MENIIKGIIALGVVGLAAVGVKVYGDKREVKGYAAGRVQGMSEMWDLLDGKSEEQIEAELKKRGYAVR